MKANKEMTEDEFAYTFALKRMMNDLTIVQHDLDTAKLVGMQGVSKGALMSIELCLYDLKANIYNALKTVA